MNPVLNDLIGKYVEVVSLGAETRYVDIGVLEAFDANWIRIRKDNGEILCFSLYNIRLLKPID